MTTTVRRAALCVLAAISAASCRSAPLESWGFVATLGNDTTSIERITREGDRITGEQVGRSPVVVHRRWQATLDSAGLIRHWIMDTRVPNAPAGDTALHHELVFTGDRVRVIRRAGRDSTDRTFINAYRRTVPWNAFLYATWEDLIRAARDLPDTAAVGQYFFEGWEAGRFGSARVGRLPDGGVTITSSGLAGTGVAQLDEAGRMVSYSGEGTTYQQRVRRVATVPDIGPIVERFAADERARGFSRWLSSRDTVRAAVGAAQVTIDYGRPLARGRTLVGGLIPLDRVWRTGANAATQLTVSAPVRLAGVPLNAGTYTLWTLPRQDGVDLIINAQHGQWGTEYRAERDVARRPLEVSVLEAPVERFTIRVDSARSSLVMEWGTFGWSAPITGPATTR
jgi:hypothetical protein